MTDLQRILVLDDDPAIGTLVKRCLAPGGFEVEAVTNGQALRRALVQRPVHLVILDLNLPGEDGLNHLRDLRAKHDIPVIILTARGEPIDRVVGLELGADDYLAKPFEPRELLARVRTILRRARPRPIAGVESGARALAFGEWTLDLAGRVLERRGGKQVPLTAAQFDILAVLVTHPNRTLSREQILDLARARAAASFDRSIDIQISHLRRKLEDDPKRPKLIKTVYGAGYVFSVMPRPV